MDVSAFMDHIQSFPDYSDQIVHREVIPARQPVYKTMAFTRSGENRNQS